MTWRQGEWGRVLAIMALTLVVGGGGLFVLAKVLERQDANRAAIGAIPAAIISSCDTLNDKIRESQLPPPPDSSTALLIGELVKLLPPDKVREFAKRVARERKQGGRLKPADCEAAAARAVERARAPD